MDRFEALLQRKSTRHYAHEVVSKDMLEQIRADTESLHLPFFDEGGLKIELIEDGEKIHRASRGILGNIGKNHAPHYLVLSGKPVDGMRENAGFAGEHLCISLTAMGLANCWLGGHIKNSALPTLIDTSKGHELAALIAFGRPREAEAHLRKDFSLIRRKPLELLSADGSIDPHWQKLLQAMRIAPSAMNSQPWRFYCDGKRLHLFIQEAGSFLSRKMLGKINFVDAGIALCHLAEAAAHFKRQISYESTPDVRYGELIYITTIVDTNK